MGKKSKKLGNNWDLTAEEQAQKVEDFYKFETGQIDFDTLTNNKRKSKLNSNGLTAGIEELILRDMMRTGEVNQSPVSNKTNMEIAFANRESGSKTYPLKKCTIDTQDCRKIVFDTRYTDELSKVVIDDDISPTTVSLVLAIDQDLAVALDADDTYGKIITLYDFIISQKYPTAIYSYFEFYNNYDFSRVIEGRYDESKFRFIISNGYVLAYAIDDESVTRFKKILDENNYDQTDLLKTYLSIADSCRVAMQSFFPEDLWYIEELYNSSYNQKNEFHETFMSDLGTSILPMSETPRKDIDGVEPEDCGVVVTAGTRLIDYLTGEEEDYDDSEDIAQEMDELLSSMDLRPVTEDNEMEDLLDDEDYEEGEDDYPTVIEEKSNKVEIEESQIVTKTTTEVDIKQSTVISTENPKEVIASIDKEISDLLSDDMEVIEEKTVTKLKTVDNDDDNFKIPVVRRK